MGVLRTTKINTFYGGLSDDVREQNPNYFAYSKGFDIFTNPHRLTPRADCVGDNSVLSTSSTMTTFFVQNFEYGNSVLYGLGQKNTSSNVIRILENATAYLTDWSFSASATQTTTGTPARNTFKYYKGYLYGLKVSDASTSQRANIWRYGDVTSGAKALTTAYGGADVLTIDDSSLSRTAQGIIGKDANLYLPYENKLARVNTAHAVTAAVLTLPSDITITALASYGSYLAIGCKPIAGSSSNSKVYLWDMVSDDITDIIDWGNGDLLVLENIEGSLIGISQTSSTSYTLVTKTIIRSYNGGSPLIEKELPYGSLKQLQAKIGNKLYFILLSNSTYECWVYGRKGKQYPFATTVETVIDTSTLSGVFALITIGDAKYFSTGKSSTYGYIRRTDVANQPYAVCQYKSQEFNAGDLNKKKALKYVALSHRPLPSSAKVTVKYAIDDTSTMAIAFSNSVVGSVFHEATKSEHLNQQFPYYNEIQFEVDTTGFAEPVELKFVEEELSTLEPK